MREGVVSTERGEGRWGRVLVLARGRDGAREEEALGAGEGETDAGT